MTVACVARGALGVRALGSTSASHCCSCKHAVYARCMLALMSYVAKCVFELLINEFQLSIPNPSAHC